MPDIEVSAAVGTFMASANAADMRTALALGTVSTLAAPAGSTLLMSLDTQQEFTRQKNFNSQALTDAASIAWNLDTQQAASVTLAGNRTLANPTNMRDGGTYLLRVTQDGTGGRTLAFGSAYKWPGGSAPTLSTAPGAVDLITFASDGVSMLGSISQDFS